MKRLLMIVVLALTLASSMGCATMGGAVVGTGIGVLAGDPLMGAAVGTTAGAVVDIFG